VRQSISGLMGVGFFRTPPCQAATAAISRFTLCTVPVPQPSFLAVFRMPAPVANCSRICATTASVMGPPTEPFSFRPRTGQPGLDPFLDDVRLELGKDAHHLKHRFPGWRAGVDTLLMQVEINALGVQFGEEGDQLLQRATEPINRPRRYLIEFTVRNTVT
jgi:hypothetical protein